MKKILFILTLFISASLSAQPILTDHGYVDASLVQIGDTVLDGAIKNVVTGKDYVNSNTYSRYDSSFYVPDTLTGIVINGTYTICKYQSLYCNGSSLKHGSELIVGDIIYHPSGIIVITSLSTTILSGWYRFEISGNHNYVVAGLKVHNASRYWVGGTGAWQAGTISKWSGVSGGAGGSTVPDVSDDVIFDAASGAANYTCTISGTVQCQDVTFGQPSSGFLTVTNSTTLNIYGNFTMTSGATVSSSGTWSYRATSGTKTITTGGVTLTQTMIINGLGGTFQLQDNYTTATAGTAFTLTAGTFDANGKDVIINGTGSPVIAGAWTFYNLQRNVTGTAKTALLNITNNITVTNTFTASGNSTINRLSLASSTVGVPVIITAANVACSNVDFRDITGAGAANWNLSAITGLSGDCGGNSGITFTAPATQTATGTASFTWSTHGWTTRVPLPQDNVIINNAFVASQTITADMPRLGKDVTFGCTGSPILTISTGVSVFGSLDLTGVSTYTASANSLIFENRSTCNFNSYSLNINNPIIINSPGGVVTLTANLAIGVSPTSRNITLTTGTLNLNGFTLTQYGALANTGSLVRSINFNGGTWDITLTAVGTAWNVTGSNYSTVGTGTIKVSGSTANARTFAGGGYSYPTLWFDNATANGRLNITGSNTFTSIKCQNTNTQTIAFTAGTTNTITTAGGFQITGAASNLISIIGITAATFTLSCPSGNVVGNYLSLTNCIASGGARWFAVNSTNVSGNNGWRFGAPNNRQSIFSF